MTSSLPGAFGSRVGIWWGLVAGAFVWIGYFVFERRYYDLRTEWEHYVWPGLAVLFVSALLIALLTKNEARRWWIGFGAGVFLTVPMAALALLLAILLGVLSLD